MVLLQLEKIEHLYFQQETYTTALKNIDMTIEEGEFITFIGPSGCGKSTLLSIIAGLIEPTSGKVITGLHNKDIGYMLQRDYLLPWKTIQKNIELGLDIANQQDKSIAQQLLLDFQLAHTAKMYPAQLSGGMRQRIALARTLATEPKLLLLDEPFSALDFQTKLELESFVSQKLKEHKKTAILVTHDIHEAIAMSDRIYIFSKGPGEITRMLSIPQEIREATPIDARAKPSFPLFFNTVWEELIRDG